MIKGIITDKLDFYLDGLHNVGCEEKHNRYSDKWINLANEEQKFNCPNTYWDSDGLYFYGSNPSYVTIGEYLPSVFTFEIIFALNDMRKCTIFANYQKGGYGITIDSSNRLLFELYINDQYKTLYFPITLSTSKIYKISCSFDKRYLKGYINGKLMTTLDLEKEYNYGLSQNNTPFILGGDPNGSEVTNFFAGILYSFRAYSRVLSESEIISNNIVDNKRYPIETRGQNNYIWQEFNKDSTAYVDYKISWRIGDIWKKNNDYPCFIFATHISTVDKNGAVVYLISDKEEGVEITPPANYSYGWAWRSYSFIYEDMKWYMRGCYCMTSYRAIEPPSNIMYLNTYYKLDHGMIESKYIDSFPACINGTQFMTQTKVLTSRIVKEDVDIPFIKEGRVKYIRVRSSDGNYSNALAFIVNPDNVDFEDDRHLNEHLNDKALASIYSEDSINLGRSSLPRGENEEIIKGEKSAAIGHMVHAEGDFSLATGSETVASGLYSHAEGKLTEASGQYSHAEGGETKATGVGSHSEGYGTIASGDFSHAEGALSEASGKYSHAEGSNTLAEGESSLALGNSTIAKGKNSIAAGQGTIAASDNQFVHGTFNIEDTEGKYLEIIGNGTDNEHRSNAYAITKNGDIEFSGKVTAAEFNGPAIYDIQGQEIADYVYNIEPQNGNELLVTKGSGAEEVVVLSGWENIQEKIGSWSCKRGNIINKSEKKIINFGYINRTKYRSACIFYCQLVLFANPAEDKDSVEIEFKLEIDDFEIDPTWRPKETMKKGYHVITLMHPVRQIEPNKELVHMITVKAKTAGGSASYETGGIRAAFFGMGIDSGDVRWDGKLFVSDNFEKSQCNITFEDDDYIHRDYTITYQEKMFSELVYRTGLIEVFKFNYSDNVFEHIGDTIKGFHYNITFEDDDYIHKNNMEYIDLMHDTIGPNQDKKPIPDLVMLKFKVLGEYNSKYNYTSYYVTVQNETDTSKISDANLLLQQFFSTSSTNFEIDEGRAVSLGINFSQFKSIDTVQVKEVV